MSVQCFSYTFSGDVFTEYGIIEKLKAEIKQYFKHHEDVTCHLIHKYS